ncbi:PspC domain-containing protein [Microbispora amethystogenes]|uniref:Phage shock protein PspC N-terminal domain-containing protein n=1 Tax=Microbispora amethystogenes TaxID=1427754 RepID=A0ABQ4F7I7_9ACTN|nr:PspC domain-containing protein [Microbispora amethystogenes]GIH30743.1 hypothetical protein Mam01_09070 [Microbispora amethystogenes]
MTEAPSAPTSDPAGQPEPERVLSRHRDGRMITGVCAGLGRYTGIDPVLFRVGFAVLVLASGIGVMLYVAAFLLMRRPDGGPGHLEQWTRRMFDAETVLALLAAVFAFGLIINVASGGINRGTIVVGTLLAIVLMAAHARGVDLLTMARSMPERATGRRGMTRSTPGFAPFAPFAQQPYGPAPQPAETTAMPGTYGPRAPGRGPEPSVRGNADDVTPEDTTQDTENAAARRFASEPTRERVSEPLTDIASEPVAEPMRDTVAQPTRDIGSEPVSDVDAEHGAGSVGRADGDPPTRAFEPPAGTTPLSMPDAPGSGGSDASDAGPRDSGPLGSGTRGPVPPPRGADGYRRLSDLAREARASARGDLGSPGQAPGRAAGRGFGSGQGYGAGEPFAPHGPYTRREPYRPLGTPYAADPYGPPVAPPPRPRKPKRPRSFVSGLTICLALIVGGIMVTMQRTGTGTVGLPVVGGAVLVTIGAGLLVAAWFGRGGGLVAAGTIVALVLVGSTTVNGIPRKVGSFVWHPVTAVQSPGTYELGVGDGKLDLSDIPLKSGARLRFDASVSLGQLAVIVPPTARVEVYGFTKLGEVRIDHQVEDGTNVRFNRVLEPETPGKGDVPTIELHVKAGVGDVEVRRAA